MHLETAKALDRHEVAEEIRNRALASGRFIVVQNSMSFETPRARVVLLGKNAP